MFSSHRRMPIFQVCTMLALLSTAVYAQLPPAAEVVPAGFKLDEELDLGGSKIIRARRPNENFPKAFQDEGVQIEIMWQNSPAAEMILNMLAQQPEDPAEVSPATSIRTEPCGKERYRDGILTCKKVIMPYIGGGQGADPLVTWRVGWTGKGKDGIVGVGVKFLFGSKETAMAWIDAIIPKITKID